MACTNKKLIKALHNYGHEVLHGLQVQGRAHPARSSISVAPRRLAAELGFERRFTTSFRTALQFDPSGIL